MKRTELKLLQNEVAMFCGVSEDCVTNWGKNRNTPQFNIFLILLFFWVTSHLRLI